MDFNRIYAWTSIKFGIEHAWSMAFQLLHMNAMPAPWGLWVGAVCY